MKGSNYYGSKSNKFVQQKQFVFKTQHIAEVKFDFKAEYIIKVKLVLFLAGIGIIAFTIVEDAATGGAGIADDQATISTGIGMIMQAFA